MVWYQLATLSIYQSVIVCVSIHPSISIQQCLRQIHAAEGNPFLQPLLLIDLLVQPGPFGSVSMVWAVSSLVIWVTAHEMLGKMQEVWVHVK